MTAGIDYMVAFCFDSDLVMCLFDFEFGTFGVVPACLGDVRLQRPQCGITHLASLAYCIQSHGDQGSGRQTEGRVIPYPASVCSVSALYLASQ